MITKTLKTENKVNVAVIKVKLYKKWKRKSEDFRKYSKQELIREI